VRAVSLAEVEDVADKTAVRTGLGKASHRLFRNQEGRLLTYQVTNCAQLTVKWRIGRDWAERRGKAGCEAESSSWMAGITWHGMTGYRVSFPAAGSTLSPADYVTYPHLSICPLGFQCL
jgi:hypothetical protein